MGRVVVLILLVVLAVWLIRRALRRPHSDKDPSRKTEVQRELVSCAHCGMHLPRSEARQAEGALYCSEEHARLGKR